VRIGAAEGTGPEMLSEINTLAEDAGGRIWALEQKEQTIKVFDKDGRFIRKFGRKGKGPGEFLQVVGITQDRHGHMLVIDMPGGRISVYDTAFTITRTIKLPGGFMYNPWPGVTDTAGYLIHPVSKPRNNGPGIALVRYDSAMSPIDTIIPPTPPEDERFLFKTPDGNNVTTVPFAPTFEWELTRRGDFWSVFTGSYTIYHQNGMGDTLRIITKPFETVNVTQAEKDTALANLKWFRSRGGVVDVKKIPDVKPAVQNLNVADDGHLWVRPILADSVLQKHAVDIFDPEGRFLGRLQLPFTLLEYPRPILHHDRIIGVTIDENGDTYIVRGRIEKK
jgi:hypothetical protein